MKYSNSVTFCTQCDGKINYCTYVNRIQKKKITVKSFPNDLTVHMFMFNIHIILYFYSIIIIIRFYLILAIDSCIWI